VQGRGPRAVRAADDAVSLHLKELLFCRSQLFAVKAAEAARQWRALGDDMMLDVPGWPPRQRLGAVQILSCFLGIEL